MRCRLLSLPLVVAWACAALIVEAAESQAPSAPVPPTAAAGEEPSSVETDFTVINLPTTLRPPGRGAEFRLTHRFARGLKNGSFSDLASDLFGVDGGAQVGLELRYSWPCGAQVGVQRISDRTIELFAQQALARQGQAPVGLAALASVEGLDNFSQQYSPRLGLLASRIVAGHLGVYLVPMWVGHMVSRDQIDGSNSTWVIGLGARLLMGRSSSLVAEYSPRVAGYKATGARDGVTFGIEHQVGGHCFQLNFSNDLGTTPAQVARGQQGRRDWYVGFNLSRKFF